MPETLEISYPSMGRTIAAYVVRPDSVGSKTGVMLVVHGHGNNRYQYASDMAAFAERFNVAAVSPEYRGCGLACGRPDGEGRGTDDPYDASFLQTIDVLNAVPATLEQFPELDSSRIIAWGGSQGGHIVMLGSAWAPHTFSVTVDCCGLARWDDRLEGKTPAHWTEADLRVRDVRRVAERIRNRVWIIHGTADELVDVKHSHALRETLAKAGADFETVFIEGGDHFLAPVTSRAAETLKHCTGDILNRHTDGRTDFARLGKYRIECPGRTFEVDFGSGWASIR